MRVAVLLFVCCLVLLPSGCGSDSQVESEQEARQAAAQQARVAGERQRERRQLSRERRQRREAVRRKARREAARQQAHEAQIGAEERERRESEESEEASECDPSYSGACLDPYASDYDCEGGSGDGPEYTGAVAVVGEDHYGLDSDGDGYGCE